MSTSEQNPTPPALPRAELTPPAQQVVNGEVTRTDRVVSWIGWHIGELTGVGLPALAAITVNGWIGIVSGVVAAGWGAHEARVVSAQRRLAAARQRRALAAASTDTTNDTGNEAADVAAATGNEREVGA